MEGGFPHVNSIDYREQERVPKPKLTWEDGVYSLENILKTFSLPKVIECCDLNGRITKGKSNFDFFQMMLLYEKRRCKKVIANSLATSAEAGKHSEVGNQLLIPDDYKGWFAVLNSKTITRPVPHYRNVEQLSQSDCHSFLLGGVEPVEAVQRLRKGNDPVQSRILYPGDVLKKGNTYIATTKVRSSFFSKPQTKDEYFLLCMDSNDREVLLPFGCKGIFYVLKNKNKRPSVPIMQIKDILINVNLPCQVKLIFGRLPSTPCSFTGLLALKHAYDESSAIASSIVNLRNILMELPVSIPLLFRVAITDSELKFNKGYKDARLLCEEKVETYMRNIKVSEETFEGGTDDRPSSSGSGNSVYLEPVNPPGFDGRTDTVSENVPNTSTVTAKTSTSSPAFCPTVPQRNPSFKGTKTPPQPPPQTSKPFNPPPQTSKPSTPPQPPPQASKPSTLDRVVHIQPPPPMVRIPQRPKASREEDEEVPGDEYEELWPVARNQPQSTMLPPPPKCSQTKKGGRPELRTQRSINIGIDNGYLSFPVYQPLSQNEADEPASVVDKLNFWKCLEETNTALTKTKVTPQATGLINFSECGMSPVPTRRDKPDSRKGNVYENVDNLREVLAKTYESTTHSKDDHVYENPDMVVADAESGVLQRNIKPCAESTGSRDSGIPDDGMDSPTSDDVPSGFSQLTVMDVYNKLKELGVKKNTCDQLLKEKVDGRILLASDVSELKTRFPFLSKMDQTKIGLMIRGFKIC